MSPCFCLVAFFAVALPVAVAAQPLVPETRLVPAGASTDDQFGRAVALSGDRAVVAAAPDVCSAASPGGVHVFSRTGAGWAEEAMLVPAGAGCRVFLAGVAPVAVEADVVAVGQVTDDAGHVAVFERTAAGWAQTATLVRPGPPPAPGDAFDGFGWSVALDSGRLLVGSFLGATLFERDGAGWTAGTPLVADAAGTFGHAVALDGDRALVGGYPDAVVFRETPAGWVQEALLTSDGSRDSSTGVFAVALDGELAAVGRADQNGSRGLVSVFSRTDGTWTREPFLSNAAAHAFGGSVALDGGTLLAGAYLSNAAFRYARTGGAWVPAGRLTPDAADGAVASFGIGVALDGGRALVGAYRADGPDDPDPYDDTGAAYVFADVATSDEAGPAVTAATLSAPNPNPTAGRAALALRLAAPATVRATLVDALGRTVAVLHDGLAEAETTLAVDARGLPPGVYAVRVLGAGVAASQKLTVVR